MTKEELRKRVIDNLNNALENQYNFLDWDPEKVADDLLSYADYDFSNIEIEQIIPYIIEWQNKTKGLFYALSL